MNTMEQQKSNSALKNIELLIWMLAPIFFVIYGMTKYGFVYIVENPEFIVQFFYAMFPLLFAGMIKMVCDNYPIAALVQAIKNKPKSEDED